jgi:hypothetical protein
MKKSVLKNVGKEISFNVGSSRLVLIGKILSYEDPIVKVNTFYGDNTWNLFEIHEMRLKNVHTLTDEKKQIILRCYYGFDDDKLKHISI